MAIQHPAQQSGSAARASDNEDRGRGQFFLYHSVYIMGSDTMSQDENQLKFAAAESAVAQVSDGMILGLGTGSTAEFAVRAIGKRVQQGLRILGIPTSERTAALARGLGIPL